MQNSDLKISVREESDCMLNTRPKQFYQEKTTFRDYHLCCTHAKLSHLLTSAKLRIDGIKETTQ